MEVLAGSTSGALLSAPSSHVHTWESIWNLNVLVLLEINSGSEIWSDSGWGWLRFHEFLSAYLKLRMIIKLYVLGYICWNHLCIGSRNSFGSLLWPFVELRWVRDLGCFLFFIFVLLSYFGSFLIIWLWTQWHQLQLASRSVLLLVPEISRMGN